MFCEIKQFRNKYDSLISKITNSMFENYKYKKRKS